MWAAKSQDPDKHEIFVSVDVHLFIQTEKPWRP